MKLRLLIAPALLGGVLSRPAGGEVALAQRVTAQPSHSAAVRLAARKLAYPTSKARPSPSRAPSWSKGSSTGDLECCGSAARSRRACCATLTWLRKAGL